MSSEVSTLRLFRTPSSSWAFKLFGLYLLGQCCLLDLRENHSAPAQDHIYPDSRGPLCIFLDLFLGLPPSSVVLCPALQVTQASPNAYLFPRFSETAKLSLGAPSLPHIPENTSRLEAELTMGLSSFVYLLL